jgi:hypothetical protein
VKEAFLLQRENRKRRKIWIIQKIVQELASILKATKALLKISALAEVG